MRYLCLSHGVVAQDLEECNQLLPNYAQSRNNLTKRVFLCLGPEGKIHYKNRDKLQGKQSEKPLADEK